MDFEVLFQVIERGRYGTAMAAYSVDEGGILMDSHINALTAVIQYGDWAQVETRVAELGLTPPEIEIVEVSEETLTMVSALPEGDALASGLTLYSENCAACHGSNGEGSTLAPALNSEELRTRLSDADVARIINQGVPTTLMAAWDAALADAEVNDLVLLIRRWDELEAAGVAMPVVEAPPIDMSPEAVATGEWLFGVLCAQCHGTGGYGSPMAPALNNQLFLSETPDAAIQQIIALGVSGTSMPAWGGRLTDADIAALTAYLRSLEPNAPAIVAPSTGAASPPAFAGPPWQRN
jgi:cbb3-type cytochrome c oxidase subunit III